jgi:SAM-dependent methyltransferase
MLLRYAGAVAQVNTGIRRVLNNPRVYSAFARAVGTRRAFDEFVNNYVRPSPGLRVLDVGCGPGRFVTELPGVDYTGIDLSAEYIEAARRDYGHLGRYLVGTAEHIPADDLGTFDVVVAMALLHHLDEHEIRGLLDTTRRLLNPGGRFVCFEATFTPDMSKASRWVVSKDRGQSVLAPEGYAAIARDYFKDVRVAVHHDLLRIPYSHAIMEASDPR